MKHKQAIASLALAFGLISNTVAQTATDTNTPPAVASAPVVVVTTTNEPAFEIVEPDPSLAEMQARREALQAVRKLLEVVLEGYDPTASARELIRQLRAAHSRVANQFESVLKDAPVRPALQPATEIKPSVNPPSEVTRPTAEDKPAEKPAGEKPVTKPVEKPAEKPAQVPQDKDDQ